MSENKPVIVIKKKGGHGGHHGGAWKVAYADFVTAMMAFFMVMWLLNSAETKTKKSIATYFRKPGIFHQGSGTPLLIGEAGILDDAYVAPKRDAEKYKKVEDAKDAEAKGGGQYRKIEIVMPSLGPTVTPTATSTPTLNPKRTPTPKLFAVIPQNPVEGPTSTASPVPSPSASPGTPTDALGRGISQRALERAKLQKIADMIEKEIQASPGLKELLGVVNITMDATGLNIEIVDTEKTSMFASGSARILPPAREAFDKIGALLKSLSNPIEIVGHTDSKPFSSQAGGYSNWELSADRANAARRMLELQGIPRERFGSVVGKADRELKKPSDALSPSNRRISLKVRFGDEDLSPVQGADAAAAEIEKSRTPLPDEPSPEPAVGPQPDANNALTVPVDGQPTTAATETPAATDEEEQQQETFKALRSSKKLKKVSANKAKDDKVPAPPENPSPAETQALSPNGFFGNSPVIGPPSFTNF